MTVAVLAVLVGVVSFRGGAGEKSEVAKVLALIERLQAACALHHAHTGTYAREYTNYAAPHRQLSAKQATPGWCGPYLDAPLAHGSSNPFGNLHLYDNPRANSWVPGFDVDGDGAVDVDTRANMLWLSGVDEETARVLDRALDGTPDGDAGGEWSESGRLRYDAGARYAFVLIHH